MSWETFKRIVDEACVPDGNLASEMRYVRGEAVNVGSELGHWEVVRAGGGRRIIVAPPVLARLPWPGLPRAVLCGSRSPDTLVEICRVRDAIGGLSVSTSPQHHHPYAAARLELRGESEEQLTAAAHKLGVRYNPTPAAWSIAIASGSVEGYLSALRWEEREDLNWDRREFDPELLQLRPSVDGDDRSGLRLVNYSHPSGWDWRDWLWNDGASADADRSWGRYCVLASAGRSVLRYDHRDGVATVPRQLPLPRLLARALALSSGTAPSVVPGSGIGLRTYASVPRPVFEVVSKKLNQDWRQASPGEEGPLA